MHVLAAAALLLIPLFWGESPPVGPFQVVVLNPPPPPPPPLSLGSAEAKRQPEQKRQPEGPPERATPKPATEFVAPREEKPVEPEPSTPRKEDLGSPEGMAEGDPEGMLEGTLGGTVGGVPGGVLGGVIGGTGVVADYDQPPRLLYRPKLVYPHEAFVKRIEGRVSIEIVVDVSGRVVRHRIIESVPELDRAAVEFVYQWVFVPAIKQGRPVATVVSTPVVYRIL